jgi:RNA polymerase sigma factor (sigma-70 family)
VLRWEVDTLMASASYVEAVAKVIRIPVGRVRAYLERLKERPEGPESIPSVVRYATIKAEPILAEPLFTIQEVAPEAAELEGGKRWELDDLHNKWGAASPDERPAALEDIRRSAHKLGTAVMRLELHEAIPGFASEVAATVVDKIAAFQRKNKSKFSTYVYGIAKKKALARKRKFARDRRRAREYADYVREKDQGNDPWSSADARLLKADLLKGLSHEKMVLLNLMCEGRNTLEIAQILHITQHAAESRVRRLRERLIKKIESK